MTIPSKHKIIQEIRTAWGRSCTKIIFFSTAENTSSYIIGLGPNDDKPHDVAKGFQHIYNNYINESEWFLTATPDVFIFMENLRYFLATQNPDEPIRFGCREKISILSKEALIRYGKRTSTIKHCNVASVYKRYFSSSLDYCFRRIGIVSVNTKDKYGKRRVVCYDMQYFIYSLDTVDSQPMYSNRHGIRVVSCLLRWLFLDTSAYKRVVIFSMFQWWQIVIRFPTILTSLICAFNVTLLIFKSETVTYWIQGIKVKTCHFQDITTILRVCVANEIFKNAFHLQWKQMEAK